MVNTIWCINIVHIYSLCIFLPSAAPIRTWVFGVECSNHSVMHALHISLTFLTLPQLNSEDVTSLREESNLFLIFYLLPPWLFPSVADCLVQILTPLTRKDTCEWLVGKGEVGGGRSEVGEVARHEGGCLGQIHRVLELVWGGWVPSWVLWGRRLAWVLGGHHYYIQIQI
jgi:hypothetical protein